MDTWAPKVGDKVRVFEHQPSVYRKLPTGCTYDLTPPKVRVQKVKRYTKTGTMVLDDGTKYRESLGWRLVRTEAQRRANPYTVEVVPADTSKMRPIIMSAMRFNGRRFASVGDITMGNGFEYYEVCDLLEQLKKAGLAECSFAREAECDWRLTEKGMKHIEMPGNDLCESAEVAAERERLHDALWDAFEGSSEGVRSPAWLAASAELSKFRAIHGEEYNPD